MKSDDRSPVDIGLVMPLASQRGGAELMLLHLLRASAGEGRIRYHLAFFEQGEMVEEALALGYSVQVISVGRLRQPAAFLAAIGKLRRWIAHRSIRIVMSWMAKAHLYAGIAARLENVPAIWWQHAYPAHHWMDKVAARIPARKILACSQAAARSQAKLKPTRPIQVIYPAVDFARYSALELSQTQVREKLGLPQDALIVGIVGRLQRWKGAHLLLAAAAKLLSSFPALHVLVVGGEHTLEPDYLQSLQHDIELLGIQDRAIFAGHQTNIPEWMVAMDVVVNVSRHEPFGMVVIEAMAAGRPVVAVNSGGPAEVITSGVNGILIESDNATLLTAALHDLLCSAELRTRIGQAAVERARAFDVARLVNQTTQALLEINPT